MDQDLITLARYRTEPEAAADKASLEEEGLQAFITNAQSVASGLGETFVDIHLQVPSTELERAKALLESLGQRRKEREETEWQLDEDEESPLKCLSCQAPMREEDTKCPKCGWSYAEGEGGGEPASSPAPG